MKQHSKTTRSKRIRKRLKAQIRRLRKQVDSLKAGLPMGPAMPISSGRPQLPSAAMIYGSELHAIQKYVLRYPRLETGGSLYGWYSETGLPIIAFATGPGGNAKHEVSRFHADENYSMEVGLKMINHGLQHLGEWHSHHTLGLAQPSGIDCRAMQASVSGSPTGRFLCGIANIVDGKATFHLFYFNVVMGLDYAHTPMVLRDGESPVRIGLNKVLGSFEQEGVFA